jgi:hypothetical protein
LPAATSAATNHLPSGSLAKSIDRLEHLLCHRSKVALPFDFHSLKTDTTPAMPSHLPTNRPASALTMAKAWTQMSSEVLATKLSKIALSKAREALLPHAPRLAGCCKPQISQPSLVSYRLVVACQQAVSPAQGNFCRRSSRPNREEKTPPPPRQAARGSRFANDVRAILLAPDDPARGQIFFSPAAAFHRQPQGASFKKLPRSRWRAAIALAAARPDADPSSRHLFYYGPAPIWFSELPKNPASSLLHQRTSSNNIFRKQLFHKSLRQTLVLFPIQRPRTLAAASQPAGSLCPSFSRLVER